MFHRSLVKDVLLVRSSGKDCIVAKRRVFPQVLKPLRHQRLNVSSPSFLFSGVHWGRDNRTPDFSLQEFCDTHKRKDSGHRRTSISFGDRLRVVTDGDRKTLLPRPSLQPPAVPVRQVYPLSWSSYWKSVSQYESLKDYFYTFVYFIYFLFVRKVSYVIKEKI